MKSQLADLLAAAVAEVLPDAAARPHVERTRDPAHGDFASNLALALAKPARRAPRELAAAIVAALPAHPQVRRVEIAGPGFINFYLEPMALAAVVFEILDAGAAYGLSGAGAGVPVMVEFVSANPTGPLHVGHGRGAAYGDCVARLLEASGFRVHREYYVNDAGRQMDILALSLWLRYLQVCGEELAFPEGAYQGDYVGACAARLHRRHGDRFRHPAAALDGLADGAGRDAWLDAAIARARELLGGPAFEQLQTTILQEQLDDIADDLDAFRVRYHRWFSERSLVADGAVRKAIERLREAGYVYEDAGATWFASARLGDEKDRVLLRTGGSHTYFAADIAYHLDKLERGYARLINVWGADHHGYVARVQAAVTALTGDAGALAVQLVQFANLYRGAERLPMSTRAGEYVTLRALREEVGTDAARYFYIMRSNDQHLDFDLELAKSRSNENPVYYVQYAHARVCSVMAQAQERGLDFDREQAQPAQLDQDHEQRLLTALSRYPEVVAAAAAAYAPHALAHYLRELADAFHSYYNAHTFLVDAPPLRNARLALVLATRQVLVNGLGLLGVTTPEAM